MKTSSIDRSLIRSVHHAHQTVLELLHIDAIAIDMTVGNGHDTIFLAKNAKKVFGFDIQEEAINTTRKRLKEYKLDNVELILDCHSNIDDYSIESATVVMFNLGYLPNYSHNITTKSETTLKALKSVLKKVLSPGLISVTVYVGHEQGQEEAKDLETFLRTLDSKDYSVIKYQCINRKQAPYNLYIYKH